MTNPISGIDQSLFTPGSTSTAQGNNQLDNQAFLKLMVAQLKYQDPMNPADGTEFMAQTAQYTMVEKLNELSKQMTESLASEKQTAAAGMIGRWVSATDTSGAAVTGTVTGVRLSAGGPVLTLGDTEVPLSAVKEV